jgi:hypothetical protein
MAKTARSQKTPVRKPPTTEEIGILQIIDNFNSRNIRPSLNKVYNETEYGFSRIRTEIACKALIRRGLLKNCSSGPYENSKYEVRKEEANQYLVDEDELEERLLRALEDLRILGEKMKNL